MQLFLCLEKLTFLYKCCILKSLVEKHVTLAEIVWTHWERWRRGLFDSAESPQRDVESTRVLLCKKNKRYLGLGPPTHSRTSVWLCLLRSSSSFSLHFLPVWKTEIHKHLPVTPLSCTVTCTSAHAHAAPASEVTLLSFVSLLPLVLLDDVLLMLNNRVPAGLFKVIIFWVSRQSRRADLIMWSSWLSMSSSSSLPRSPLLISRVNVPSSRVSGGWWRGGTGSCREAVLDNIL